MQELTGIILTVVVIHLAVLVALVLAITTIPEIVLWLPHTMGYVTQ